MSLAKENLQQSFQSAVRVALKEGIPLEEIRMCIYGALALCEQQPTPIVRVKELESDNA